MAKNRVTKTEKNRKRVAVRPEMCPDRSASPHLTKKVKTSHLAFFGSGNKKARSQLNFFVLKQTHPISYWARNLLEVLRQEAGGMKEGTKLYSKKDENYRLNID